MDTIKITEDAAQKAVSSTTDAVQNLTERTKAAANATSETVLKSTETMKASMEKNLTAGQEALQQTHAETQRLTRRGVEMSSETVNAYVAASHKTADLMAELNQTVTDLCGRTLSQYDDLTRQAMGIRSFQDMLSLQNAATEALTDHLTTFGQIYGQYFDGLRKVMQPITDQAAKTQKAMGA